MISYNLVQAKKLLKINIYLFLTIFLIYQYNLCFKYVCNKQMFLNNNIHRKNRSSNCRIVRFNGVHTNSRNLGLRFSLPKVLSITRFPGDGNCN